MTLDEFADNFHCYISCMMGERGFRFTPMLVLGGDGGLHVFALDLPPNDVYGYFWRIVAGCEKDVVDPRAVIFGLDRTTLPGQGTEFADVLTCVFWWDDPAINWGRSFKVGVINYQPEPRIIRPWDWDNTFWNDRLTYEVKATRPEFRIKAGKTT